MKGKREITVKVIENNNITSKKMLAKFFADTYYEKCKKKELPRK